MNDWSFSGFGPQFDEHADAHLPHYSTAHEIVSRAASYALPPGGTVADLGCSTGAAVAAVADRIPDRAFTAYLYDLDESMIEHAISRLHPHRAIDVRARPGANLLDTDSLDHDAANVTLALWTLQFLPSATWVDVLHRAHQRADVDGVLLVAAKTRMADSRWQEIADGALSEWKAEHGVTPAEALSKARSLRGTMMVASVGRIIDDITRAGWCSPAVLFRWHAWVVIGAWASPVHESPFVDVDMLYRRLSTGGAHEFEVAS